MKATYKNVTKLEAQINAQDKRTEYINAIDALGGYNGQTFFIATAPLDVRLQAAQDVLGA